MALLSQKGSTIETAVEIVRGVVPEPHSLRMQFDHAALLTQDRIAPEDSYFADAIAFSEACAEDGARDAT